MREKRKPLYTHFFHCRSILTYISSSSQSLFIIYLFFVKLFIYLFICSGPPVENIELLFLILFCFVLNPKIKEQNCFAKAIWKKWSHLKFNVVISLSVYLFLFFYCFFFVILKEMDERWGWGLWLSRLFSLNAWQKTAIKECIHMTLLRLQQSYNSFVWGTDWNLCYYQLKIMFQCQYIRVKLLNTREIET